MHIAAGCDPVAAIRQHARERQAQTFQARVGRMLTEAWTRHLERQVVRASEQLGARKSRPAPRTADLSGVLTDICLR
jgi:hypothetical protein